MTHPVHSSERKLTQLNTNPVGTNSYDFTLKRKHLFFPLQVVLFQLGIKTNGCHNQSFATCFYLQMHLWKKLQVNTPKVQEFKVVLLFFFKKNV